MRNIHNAIASTFEYFECVVEAFHKSAGSPVKKIIRDVVQRGVTCGQKPGKTRQALLLDLEFPLNDVVHRVMFGERRVKDACQILTGSVDLL